MALGSSWEKESVPLPWFPLFLISMIKLVKVNKTAPRTHKVEEL